MPVLPVLQIFKQLSCWELRFPNDFRLNPEAGFPVQWG